MKKHAAKPKENKYEVEVFEDGEWIAVKSFDDWFVAYAVASGFNQVTKAPTRVTVGGKPEANYGRIKEVERC